MKGFPVSFCPIFIGAVCLFFTKNRSINNIGRILFGVGGIFFALNLMSAIKATEGVKAAFIERHHKPMVVEGDAGALGAEAVDPALQNASSLEMTRANQTAQKGDRQVVEVIDTGIEATHQAFSGSMDGVDVRLSQGDVEALVGKLPHGKAGAYLNKKIQ